MLDAFPSNFWPVGLSAAAELNCVIVCAAYVHREAKLSCDYALIIVIHTEQAVMERCYTPTKI